jgi:hypothetical protein
MKVMFPDDYKKALDLHKNDHAIKVAATTLCGQNYSPYKDGPGMMVELLMSKEGEPEEWASIVSEVIPQEVMDRLAQAKAEWHKVSVLSDSELWTKILKEAVQPKLHLKELIPGLGLSCVGVYPLDEFLDAGNLPVQAKSWVRWFMDVSNWANNSFSSHAFPELEGLAKICEKLLKSHP